MTNGNQPAELFDRKRRRNCLARAEARTGGDNFLNQMMAEELLERLSLVNREFDRCLVIGPAPQLLYEDLRAKGLNITRFTPYMPANQSPETVVGDEDQLPFADHSFDLVICIGSLDSVNDLPGALVLIRRILRPDGLFLAAFPGAESLTTLKALFMEAEGDRVAPHIHPQIDVRTLGDLLSRAGFALPVVDGDTLQLKYRAFADMIRDIRDYGGSNILNGHKVMISKSVYDSAKKGFASRVDDQDKVTETIELLYICGWAPHPDQPKPAPRGSGNVSLKTALGDK